jgi:hypothetical protein
MIHCINTQIIPGNPLAGVFGEIAGFEGSEDAFRKAHFGYLIIDM